MNRRRCLIGLSLLAIAILAAGSPAATSLPTTFAAENAKYRLVITVRSADRNEPVEGATVSVNYMYDPAFVPIPIDTQSTDQSGKVWVIPGVLGGFIKVQPKPGARFDIMVTHPDFIESYRPVPIRSDTNAGDIPISVSLKRKSGGKVVAVTVVSAGDRAPIYDATVKLKGTNAVFSGSTNSSGLALVTVTQGDDYEVTVTHTGFESVNASIPVKMYDDDQGQYSLNLEMKTTREEERFLRVSVSGKDKEGRIGPVRYAQVTLPDGQTKTTDFNGQVQFKHKFPPGEEFKVEAEATHFKPGSGSFTVGVRRQASDSVRIFLEREGGDEAERALRVLVTGKDKEGKPGPVRYAQVTLPDGQTKTTDYEGHVEFKHKLPAGEEAKLEVEATYFKPGSSSFTVGTRQAGDTVNINLEREDQGDCQGFAGRWNTNGGMLTIRLTGNSAAGDYNYQGPSTISGTVSGNTLAGNWSQPQFPDPKTRSGRMQFILSPDGQSFSGKWWDATGADRGAWSGTRTGCP